jgi:hypothetical protein
VNALSLLSFRARVAGSVTRAAAAQALLLLMVAHSLALAQPQQPRPAAPGSGAAQSPTTPAGAKPKPGQRFTDTVPGSLVSWEMIPLPPPPGNVSRAKALWIGKTEVPWELYDIYAFRLDLSEAEKAKDSAEKNASDAASRPSGRTARPITAWDTRVSPPKA